MITREDMLEQSVQDYARTQVFTVRGYPSDSVKLIDSFPYGITKLDKNIIAMGFNFDDAGEQAEMGSGLTRKLLTIEFYVFGQTATWARNLASAVKFSFPVDERVPIKDLNDQAQPVIDYALVHGSRKQREPITNPDPWQEHTWLVQVVIEDIYDASLT